MNKEDKELKALDYEIAKQNFENQIMIMQNVGMRPNALPIKNTLELIRGINIAVIKLTKTKETKAVVKKEPLIDRQRQFYLDVQEVCNKTGLYFVIMEAFCAYWNEENKGKTKAKHEMQKTFNIELRLKTWSNNGYGNKTNSRPDISNEEHENLLTKFK